MAVEEATSSGEEGAGAWTREQEKAFENAVATMAEDDDDDEQGDARWEKIAELVEGKTAEEVRRHYGLLVEDVDGIEAGRVPLPTYARDADEGGGKKGSGGDKGSAKSAEQERRKGIAWTEDEHRFASPLFLSPSHSWSLSRLNLDGQRYCFIIGDSCELSA
jgi:hypothetical protein